MLSERNGWLGGRWWRSNDALMLIYWWLTDTDILLSMLKRIQSREKDGSVVCCFISCGGETEILVHPKCDARVQIVYLECDSRKQGEKRSKDKGACVSDPATTAWSLHLNPRRYLVICPPTPAFHWIPVQTTLLRGQGVRGRSLHRQTFAEAEGREKRREADTWSRLRSTQLISRTLGYGHH